MELEALAVVGMRFSWPQVASCALAAHQWCWAL